MKITKVNIYKGDFDGKLEAFASVVLDDQILLKGLKVINGSKGLFVAMPSKKVKDDYQDIFHPINKEFREQLINAVLDEYNKDEDTEEMEELSATDSDIPF